MATASSRQSRATIEKGAATTAPQVDVAAPSRREFLYYIWGASIVLFLGQVGAGIVWFALPIFREGEFGGVFKFPLEDLPPAGAPPVSVPAGRFHISNTPGEGLVALYGVCTHLGCLPRWDPSNDRFLCPCHGSQFEIDGDFIGGPAPRGLDRFPLTITLANGTTLTNAGEGSPIPIEGIEDQIIDIAIDTGARDQGLPAGQQTTV